MAPLLPQPEQRAQRRKVSLDFGGVGIPQRAIASSRTPSGARCALAMDRSRVETQARGDVYTVAHEIAVALLDHVAAPSAI